jgi:hypothetical protein
VLKKTGARDVEQSMVRVAAEKPVIERLPLGEPKLILKPLPICELGLVDDEPLRSRKTRLLLWELPCHAPSETRWYGA